MPAPAAARASSASAQARAGRDGDGLPDTLVVAGEDAAARMNTTMR
jgi:hypothetical protein